MRRACLFVVLLGACHTQQVGRADRAPQAQDKPPDQSVHLDINTARPVHATPRGYLSHDAVRKIQRALATKGERVEETGKLDGATTAALKHFQKAQRQPDTGFPDFGTVNLLGLDANQLYGGKADKQTDAAGLVK